MYKLYCASCSIVLCLSALTTATIVDFDNLLPEQNISGSYYKEIFWNYSSEPGAYFNTGSWISHHYNPTGNDPDNNILTNSYGCTKISFQFPVSNFPNGVFAYGAYFCGYGNKSNWPLDITATGFMKGNDIWSVTLNNITADLHWFAMEGSMAIDQIAITVTPKYGYDPIFNEYGYFGMDNLTFEKAPEPMTLLLLILGITAIRHRK